MLVLLGIHLLEQDRSLEARFQERLASAALERGASGLQKDIAAIAAQLRRGSEPGCRVSRSAAAWAWPPAISAIRSAVARTSRRPSAVADRLEFPGSDLNHALAICRGLARSPDPALRAGPLLRLARLHCKAGHLKEALQAWASRSPSPRSPSPPAPEAPTCPRLASNRKITPPLPLASRSSIAADLASYRNLPAACKPFADL